MSLSIATEAAIHIHQHTASKQPNTRTIGNVDWPSAEACRRRRHTLCRCALLCLLCTALHCTAPCVDDGRLHWEQTRFTAEHQTTKQNDETSQHKK